MLDWQWDEMRQIGTDYADLAEVEIYDNRMASFRDVDGENRDMLGMLALPAGSDVLEIGCGTGRFSRAAAAAGHKVTAVDVSAIMLEYVRAKAEQERLSVIKTCHCGFLTMDFPAASFDAVVSGAALHHLPDVWKFVALRNIARVLKTDGQFILRDVVFDLKKDEAPQECFVRFINSFNDKVRPGAIGHVSKEYSTYTWKGFWRVRALRSFRPRPVRRVFGFTIAGVRENDLSGPGHI
jgi:ubiquinone/menaquinone biosynthesis C-methylase UbiE